MCGGWLVDRRAYLVASGFFLGVSFRRWLCPSKDMRQSFPDFDFIDIAFCAVQDVVAAIKLDN